MTDEAIENLLFSALVLLVLLVIAAPFALVRLAYRACTANDYRQ